MDKMIESLSERVGLPENTYLNETDGLLHCMVCKSPVQTKIIHPFKNKETIVNCICKCREMELAENKRSEAAAERERRRMTCFSQTNMATWNFANDDRRDERLSNAMEKYVMHFEEFKQDGMGLLLYGSVGTGKTYYASCVANGVIDKDYRVLVTSLRELTNKLQGMWEGKQEYIDSLNRYALVIFDDLGAERGTEYMQEQIFNIIDSRYRSGLPFIVTTNLTMEQLKKPQEVAYQRIYDRVLERCHPVKIEGVSRRRLNVADTYHSMNNKLGL